MWAPLFGNTSLKKRESGLDMRWEGKRRTYSTTPRGLKCIPSHLDHRGHQRNKWWSSSRHGNRIRHGLGTKKWCPTSWKEAKRIPLTKDHCFTMKRNTWITAYAIEQEETLPFIWSDDATSLWIAFFDFVVLQDCGAGRSFSTSESVMLSSLAEVGEVKICL